MTILRSTDNPHELMDVKCEVCRERLIATREEVHNAGWGQKKYFISYEYYCPKCFIKPEPT